MKHNFHSVVLLFLLAFLISTSHSSARKLAAKGEKIASCPGLVDEKIKSKESVGKMESIDSFDKVLGAEECQNEDEECLKRRVIAEAQLDYIYTQHHKP